MQTEPAIQINPSQPNPNQPNPNQFKPTHTNTSQPNPNQTKPNKRIQTKRILNPNQSKPMLTNPIQTNLIPTKPIQYKPIQSNPNQSKLIQTKQIYRATEDGRIIIFINFDFLWLQFREDGQEHAARLGLGAKRAEAQGPAAQVPLREPLLQHRQVSRSWEQFTLCSKSTFSQPFKEKCIK